MPLGSGRDLVLLMLNALMQLLCTRKTAEGPSPTRGRGHLTGSEHKDNPQGAKEPKRVEDKRQG